jgi:hypothetical protein
LLLADFFSSMTSKHPSSHFPAELKSPIDSERGR